MKAFLTNLSQLFHINGFAKKKKKRRGRQRASERLPSRDVITYLTAMKYIYATYAILIKLTEKNVQTLYFWVRRENLMCCSLTAHTRCYGNMK